MKKSFTIGLALLAAAGMNAENRIPVYNYVTFYDGYRESDIPEDAPEEDGCRIIYTYLKTKKLSDEVLNSIGEHLTMEVNMYARCDNYDRIGGVNLAFIPKGQDTYDVTYTDADPLRIEVARFITPFMNMNKQPDMVTYTYQIDNLSAMLRDKELREKYDFWLEFDVFGVPYAAWSEIKGCGNHQDVWGGTITFITDDTPAPLTETDVFVPVTMRDSRPDRGMNNYNESGTDEIGKCIKTFNFDVPKDVKNGRIVIVMSNHGSNSGGEEYNRRFHLAKLDDTPIHGWTPGRPSCEPFRKYNTQYNGIYGLLPKSDKEWQSFSNWCPGAPIPFQTFETGALEAGQHSVTINVMQAKFSGGQGYFPVSIYFQGDTEKESISAPIDYDTYLYESDVETVMADETNHSEVTIENMTLTVTSDAEISEVKIFDLGGKAMVKKAVNGNHAAIDLRGISGGAYIVTIATGGNIETHKIVL